ncbi:MAG: hypothetical protein PPP58_10495 [Natronomonas sp.]
MDALSLPVLFSEVPLVYSVVVVLEGILAVSLFALLGLAFHRQRSVPYLLLWVASSTLVIRSIVGVIPMLTVFDPMTHAIVDHGLDIVLIVVAFGAVYYARHVEKPLHT